MDRGAWQATVCGVTEGRTRLSDKAQHSEPGVHSARDTGRFSINKKGKGTGSLLGRQNKDQRLWAAPRGQGFCYPLHIFHAEPGPCQPIWRQGWVVSVWLSPAPSVPGTLPGTREILREYLSNR